LAIAARSRGSRDDAGVQPSAVRLDQVRRPQRVARAQADQLAVRVGGHAVRVPQVAGAQRAIPAPTQVALHALLVDVDGQLAARGIQRRAIRGPIHNA
jgi:hypothetical protein